MLLILSLLCLLAREVVAAVAPAAVSKARATVRPPARLPRRFIFPIEIKAKNINEKHVTDRADTTDCADAATDRADVIYYLSDSNESCTHQ